MEKMRKPARTLVVAAAAVLLFVGVLVLASTQPWKPAKKLLSPIDPAQVTLVSIRNGNKVTRMDITDPEEIRDIVELLNGFTYQSTRYVPRQAAGATFWMWRALPDRWHPSSLASAPSAKETGTAALRFTAAPQVTSGNW